MREGAAELAAARGPRITLDTKPALVAAIFTAYEHLRLDGSPTETWAELSGFYAARCG